MLSRMEGMLAEGTVPEVALTGFAGAIRKRLEALSDSQKAALMKMPEVKALDVETLEKLPEAIKIQIQDLGQLGGASEPGLDLGGGTALRLTVHRGCH